MRTVEGDTNHVVVVGAGLAGLSAALHLAGRGRTVTVVERGRFPGGRVGRVDIDGYRLDTGPTVLTMPDIIEEAFAAVTVPLSLNADFKVGIFSGLAVRGPSSVETIVSPCFDFTVTGTISFEKSADLARAREVSANSSCISPMTLIGKSLGYSMRESFGWDISVFDSAENGGKFISLA